MKIKLGLIGKDISHSKSPGLYKRFLGNNLDYTLLDFKQPAQIPPLIELFEHFNGLSITAPYKDIFTSQIFSSDSPISAVNTLGLVDGNIRATNTDYLACEEILKRYKKNLKIKKVHLLGDGVMSGLIQKILEILNIEFKIYSRRLGNLYENISEYSSPDSVNLIINTCAREYTFGQVLSSNFYFWDLNYALDKHVEHFKLINIEYIDGLELLELQAKYALRFWNLKEI